MEEENRDKTNLVSLISYFLNFISLIAVGYLSFISNKDTVHTTALSDSYLQINSQSNQIITLRELVVALQREIIELESRLSVKVDEKSIVSKFLDRVPFPVWMKRYDEVTKEFIMNTMNDSYTAYYGITRSSYIGKTDFDVHSYDNAALYYKNDLAALNSNDSIVTNELVTMPNGEKVEIRVHKWVVTIDNVRYVLGSSILLE